MPDQANLSERIAEVLDRAQAFGGKESLSSENLADLIVETLGLTQDFAVCFEDDEKVWLIGDTRYTRAEFAAVDVPDHAAMLEPFVGTAWTTRWERTNG
ncbi:hypothetical protein A5784_30715 [Mycobacterium sp. 852013-50091_SCH5140682]|uniref:hypothetical protein n=1 Tax=Mycobacterium sp. 852013-50091_SCH5140682 TaxID=1834109 RepID=UPI0007E9AC7C|nr:hypothetical protein [Mycobacterium sp. 852013-50091_SCH5140682]OBC14077.1 hypothetical protein A5784_30715 [Mycobacterium sp. 852013-50091_SCH5140682]